MSQEILLSELDLFKKIQFQGSIESSQFVQYRPISTIDGSTIEFDINVAADEYMDMQNVFIFLKGRATKQDGTDYVAADDNNYSLINYGVNTIFDQCSVYLNGTMISQSSKTYSYLSYLQALTETDFSKADTELKAGGFVSSYGNAAFNHGAINSNLFNIVSRSKTFTLYGRCHADIFKCDRLMLNGINMRIIFSRAPDKFVFKAQGAIAAVGAAPAVPAYEPKLNLTESILYVRKARPNPNLLTAHAKILMQSKAIYPLKRTQMKILNMPANQNSYVFDNVFMSQMPCKMILGIINNDAFNGTYTTNPFYFQNYDLSFLAVYINGEMFPKTPYEPNFTTGVRNIEREYYEFLLNLGTLTSPITPPIDFANWTSGHTLYCFNFNSDFTQGSDFINLSKEGFLSIEIRLRANLNYALKLVVLGVFDNILEIDESRNVTVDFS